MTYLNQSSARVHGLKGLKYFLFDILTGSSKKEKRKKEKKKKKACFWVTKSS